MHIFEAGETQVKTTEKPVQQVAVAPEQSESKKVASKIIKKIGELQGLNNDLLVALDEENQYKTNPHFKDFISVNNKFSAMLHVADKLFSEAFRKIK